MLIHIYQILNSHFYSANNFYCYNMQHFLYRTVTKEKAAKQIVTSVITKWPHRETFSASSSCCINLWIKGTVHRKY